MKHLYQDRKVSDYIFVYFWYRFYLSLLFFCWSCNSLNSVVILFGVVTLRTVWYFLFFILIPLHVQDVIRLTDCGNDDYFLYICTIILCRQYMWLVRNIILCKCYTHYTISFLSVNIQQNYPILKVSYSRGIVNTHLPKIAKTKIIENENAIKLYFQDVRVIFNRKAKRFIPKRYHICFYFYC